MCRERNAQGEEQPTEPWQEVEAIWSPGPGDQRWPWALYVFYKSCQIKMGL